MAISSLGDSATHAGVGPPAATGPTAVCRRSGQRTAKLPFRNLRAGRARYTPESQPLAARKGDFMQWSFGCDKTSVVLGQGGPHNETQQYSHTRYWTHVSSG